MSVRRRPLPPLSAGPHENGRGTLHPPSPLPLFARLRFVFDRGSTARFYHRRIPPPSLWIVSLEVFMGRPTGCSAHQEIKVSPTNKCALVRCDLFNSNRVNITDARKAGVTVAKLDGWRRDLPSLSFLLWFTHKDPSSICSNGWQSCSRGTAARGAKLQLLVISEPLRDEADVWRRQEQQRENTQLQFHLSYLIYEQHRPAWFFFKDSVFLTFSKNNTEAE